ncbi:toxin [Fodinibius sp. SL11]|uniref:toxin n=1 Tax=Fodinibius sp. SL11 TaxID=3425690 RepID=UPI003F880AC0
MSTNPEEVQQFLTRLKGLTHGFDIIYLDNRPKNSQTLADLEITGRERDEHIRDLEVENYSEGPLPEEFHGGKEEMWVFGKVIKGNEVYIKITLGEFNSNVICISFHIAEHKMNYPHK